MAYTDEILRNSEYDLLDDYGLIRAIERDNRFIPLRRTLYDIPRDARAKPLRMYHRETIPFKLECENSSEPETREAYSILM